MKKFNLKVYWHGYSRGYSLYEVEAETLEEAKENYYNGIMTEEVVMRDDRERDNDIDIQEISE